jgi:hypothetical protein
MKDDINRLPVADHIHPVAVDLTEIETVHQPAIIIGSPHRQGRRIVNVLSGERFIVGFLLVFAFLSRWYAALHTGLEVDEPIYHNAAELLLIYGVPVLRPAYLHPLTPFLYHPPFFFYILAGWYYLWHSTSYLTARMLSVVISCIMLLIFYLLLRRMAGRLTALLALTFLVGDLWVIFTNQAIYLENSLMILVISAIWAYWHATTTVFVSRKKEFTWYCIAGLLVGSVVIYKQIGGFIALVILLNLLLIRNHWYQHLVLLTATLLTILCYVLGMYWVFGHAFEAATFDQILRTLGLKAAPGLNDNVWTALQAFLGRYWMFFMTLIALLCGFALSVVRYLQAFFLGRKISQPLLVSWALSGMIFSIAISLKSPHYLILWIIPLYALLSLELSRFISSWNWRLFIPGSKPQQARVLSALLVFCLFMTVGNAIGFQQRFVNIPGDALVQSETYINKTLPSSAVVVTENYIGVDLTPAFLDISLINTPKLIASHHVTHLALYWTQTQPIPTSLGHVQKYCAPMRYFSGFKDQIEVCKVDPLELQKVIQATSST